MQARLNSSKIFGSRRIFLYPLMLAKEWGMALCLSFSRPIYERYFKSIHSFSPQKSRALLYFQSSGLITKPVIQNSDGYTISPFYNTSFWYLTWFSILFFTAQETHRSFPAPHSCAKTELERLSGDLRNRYGKGFGRRNILDMRRFYLAYQKGQTVSAKLS